MHVNQRVQRHASQPDEHWDGRVVEISRQLLLCFKECFLHDIRRIDPTCQSRVETQIDDAVETVRVFLKQDAEFFVAGGPQSFDSRIFG